MTWQYSTPTTSPSPVTPRHKQVAISISTTKDAGGRVLGGTLGTPSQHHSQCHAGYQVKQDFSPLLLKCGVCVCVLGEGVSFQKEKNDGILFQKKKKRGHQAFFPIWSGSAFKMWEIFDKYFARLVF